MFDVDVRCFGDIDDTVVVIKWWLYDALPGNYNDESTDDDFDYSCTSIIK